MTTVQRDMLRRTFAPGLALVVLALASAGWAGGRPTSSQPTSLGGTLLQERRDCPGHGADTLQQLAIAGRLTNIPEFHDCQKFIGSRPRLQYLEMYGIFASQYADRLWDSLRRLECTPAVRPVASPTVTDSISVPVQLSDTSCADASRAVVGIAFSEIVSWGGTYRPLGIAPNFNCLYVFNSVHPVAVMVPVGLNDPDCLRVRTLSTTVGTKLLVKRTVVDGPYTDVDYPGVARWDWDPREGVQYAGIKCGGAWCEVGPLSGFSSSPRHQFAGTTAASSARQTRVLAIKGWYDEQRLAEMDLNGNLVPSEVVGTAYPDSRLDNVRPGDFAGHWVLAAHVALSRQSKKYEATYNFRAAAVGAPQVNDYYLCQGTWDLCAKGQGKKPLNVASCPDRDKSWWGRVEAAGGGSPRYVCETQEEHHDAHGNLITMRGVVRWHWFSRDEVLWKPCPLTGCCQPRS
jgi:hypothetical protein